MIKKDYLVEKRNILNEIRTNSMSLQELRFLSIYLAKINSRDVNTRLVRFSIEDFQKIMELGRLNMKQLRHAIDSLLCKVVGTPRDDGGADYFHLFKKCSIVPNEDRTGEWFVEINAHDDALPMMFDFKEKYFTYELWNALRLKSTNQLRMYEVLKQYEWLGEKTFSLSQLKKLLGIKEEEYSRFGDFRADVLEVCKAALKEHTDIKFTYEIGKRGPAGKVLELKFIISKNEEYSDPLSLDEFIDRQKISAEVSMDTKEDEIVHNEENYFEREIYPFLSEACDNEFNTLEMQVLYNLAIKIVPPKANRMNTKTDIYDYLKLKYDELKWRNMQNKIKNRMGYIKKIIEADLKV